MAAIDEAIEHILIEVAHRRVGPLEAQRRIRSAIAAALDGLDADVVNHGVFDDFAEGIRQGHYNVRRALLGTEGSTDGE